MNAFTKVLVVLVLVLSIGFAASQIWLYGKREKLGAALDTKVMQLRQTENKANQLTADLSKLRGDTDRTIADLRLQAQDLQSKLDTSNQNVQTLQGRLDLTDASVKSLTELSQAQLGTIQTRDASIKQLQDQNADRQAQLEAKVAQVQQLTDTIKDKNANIGDLEQQVTETKKENKKLADANEDMTAKIADMVKRGIEVEPAYAPPINAKVLTVDTALKTAVIDKGSMAGVKPNTEFTVYRDSQYVARIVITDVDKQVAIGRVSLLAQGQEPKQGDDATTRIR
jgi:DNA repair exonuclease SbcCD ATPase subunit